MHIHRLTAGLQLYSLYLLLLVIVFLNNTRLFIANQQIKAAFAINDIILTIIHRKIFYLFIYIDTNNSVLKVPGHY